VVSTQSTTRKHGIFFFFFFWKKRKVFIDKTKKTERVEAEKQRHIKGSSFK
jgi:hypothetical protein